MDQFFRTGMGRKFYEADVPKLVSVLERIATQMEKSNTLEEKRFRLDEKLRKLQIKNLNEKEG
jgi:hypothetical protein|tara:strand:- start:2062 stop:2250 length:189 start_codon:yes stop_codon:yes gene_type:complete